MPSTTNEHQISGALSNILSVEIINPDSTTTYNMALFDGTLASIGVGAALYGVTPEQAFFDPDAPQVISRSQAQQP